MKILLVSPINRTYVIMPNLGLGYLAAALRKQGHQVKILHCAKEKMDYSGWESFVRENKYDLFGFQVFSYDLDSVKKHISIIKKYQPESYLIAGGPHPSGAPKQTIESLSDIDFAFAGEAENNLPEFVNRLSSYKKKDLVNDNSLAESIFRDIPGLIWEINGEVTVNEKDYIENLDEIDFPSWDLMDPREYPEAPHGAFTKNFPVAPIIITRGCSFSCTFCAGHTISGKRIRKRSISNVINEIEFLMGNFGVKEFTLEDENFTLHKDLVIEFCNQIKRRNLNISWSCPSGVRLDTLSYDLLSRMEKSGCYSFGLGIESGSQRLLNDFHKQITLKKIREKMEILSRTKIKTTGFFILGYPTDTKKSIIKTIKFAKELPLDRAQFNNFMPLPGSKIYGLLRENKELDNIKWANFFVHNVAYSPKGISPKKLKRFRQRAYLEFYLRPRILFGILKEIKSFSHFKFLIRRFIDSLK